MLQVGFCQTGPRVYFPPAGQDGVYFRYGATSPIAGTSFVPLPISRAQACFAPSSLRRLISQVPRGACNGRDCSIRAQISKPAAEHKIMPKIMTAVLTRFLSVAPKAAPFFPFLAFSASAPPESRNNAREQTRREPLQTQKTCGGSTGYTSSKTRCPWIPESQMSGFLARSRNGP